MSLKVLHVLDVLRPSGAETCLRVAGSMWGAEGISCDVLATGDELGPYAVQLREAGYRTGHLPLDDMRRFLRSFPRLVRSEGYDVVHIHVERANFHIALLSMWAGARVVQHVHNVFDFEGALRLERTVQRRIARALGVPFLGVSQDVVDNERTRYGIEAEVFLNWADIDRYRPPSDRQRAAARQALGLDEDAFVLASVANCHDFKNHDVVVRALARLPRDVVWLHVGAGSLLAQEQELAQQVGVWDRIQFLGQRDPLPSLHAADAFVMNSLYEGQGISAIEALAAGLPAVLSDVDGLRNLKGMDVPAVWCGTDVDTLVDAIEEIRTRPPQGTTDIMLKSFSPHERVPALAARYRSVAA